MQMVKYDQVQGKIIEVRDQKVIIDSDVAKACRYLVKNSGTSKSPEFSRQRDRLKAASVLFPARLL